MNKENNTHGDCCNCDYYDGFENYCSYYKIMLNANRYEPTCNK